VREATARMEGVLRVKFHNFQGKSAACVCVCVGVCVCVCVCMCVCVCGKTD
jgi:hypothetical protein